MRVFRGASVVAVTAALAASAAAALEVNSPADIPPPGYSGRQYVDSAGCVFVRAGVGSVVNWVARVSRDGTHLCGYAPTFGAPATAVAAAPVAPGPAAPAPAPASAGAPVATVALTASPPPTGLQPRPVTPPAARVAVVAPVPSAPRPTAEQVPGPYVSPYVAVSGAVAPAPAAAALPSIVAATTITNAQSVCPNLSPVAQRYMLSDGRNVVRCGPQTSDPVGYINNAGVPGLQVAGMNAPASFAAPNSVSQSVATAQVATVPPVPAGYQPAWRDDRLNPYRGVAGANGAAQMAQRWTNGVPAQAITQTAVRVAGHDPREDRTDGGAESLFAVVSVSGKSVSEAAYVPAPQAAQFVQVGTYGLVENADQARARLNLLGLPVAASHVVQGGRALQIVYAGPFDSAAALRAALSAVRGAGFRDAFAR